MKIGLLTMSFLNGRIFNKKITTENVKNADIIWLIAPWT